MQHLTSFYWLELNSCQKIHLRQPGFTYSACGPFIKNKIKKIIQKFKETVDLRHIYIWLIVRTKIYQEERLLTKYYVKRHFKLATIQIMMHIEGLPQWSF